MQDLKPTFLVLGALLLGYGSSILTYILLRKKALKTVPDLPILILSWWMTVVQFLCFALLAVAIAWLIGLAHLFARLTSLMNGICITHFAPEDCDFAALDWQKCVMVLTSAGVVDMILILWFTHKESKVTHAPPERTYPIAVLTWSHGMLVTSWILCTPLMHPLRVFGAVGPDSWIVTSMMIAPFAILAYVTGISLWLAAVVRVFFAWQRTEIGRSSGGQRGVNRGRDFELQDMDP